MDMTINCHPERDEGVVNDTFVNHDNVYSSRSLRSQPISHLTHNISTREATQRDVTGSSPGRLSGTGQENLVDSIRERDSIEVCVDEGGVEEQVSVDGSVG